MSQIDGSNRADFIKAGFISRTPAKSPVWRRHVGIGRARSYDSLDDSVLETIYLKLFGKNVQRDELLQGVAQDQSSAFFLPSLMSIFRVFGSILLSCKQSSLELSPGCVIGCHLTFAITKLLKQRGISPKRSPCEDFSYFVLRAAAYIVEPPSRSSDLLSLSPF